jgi:hypothetical protein
VIAVLVAVPGLALASAHPASASTLSPTSEGAPAGHARWIASATTGIGVHPDDRPRTGASTGYDLVGSDGGVFVFGSPGGFYGSLPGLGIHVDNIVGMDGSMTGRGYLLVGSDGGVFAFGDATFAGSLPAIGVTVNDIVGLVPSATGKGYFLVGSDGGVFAFGDAAFEGSLPGDGVHITDVVGIAGTPDSAGYWVLAADGTIYSFGTAFVVPPLVCPPPGTCVPLVSIVSMDKSTGFWVTDLDGTVYPYDQAANEGDFSGATNGPTDIVTLVPSSDDLGYLLVGSDGGLFSFGDTTFNGSLPALGISVDDIVGAVATNSAA